MMYKFSFYQLLFLTGFCAISLSLKAEAPPNWQINPTEFQYSMTLTAHLKIRAEVSSDPNDLVGIFVGSELRGVGSPSVRVAGNQYLVFMQVYSNNSSGEVLSFRMYDSSADIIVDAITSTVFQSDLTMGSVASPYLITDNYGPTDIMLSSQEIDENQPRGTVVGLFAAQDPDVGETFSFTLVSGEGSANNISFSINGNALETATVLDFETKNSYTVRIRATDTKSEYTEEIFILQVNDLNDPPTRVLLSSYEVHENSALGTEIAILSVEDEDINPSTYAYRMVSGEGDAENSSFLIEEDKLLLSTDLNFEINSSYSLRVRATDPIGLHREEVLELQVMNQNEAPTGLVENSFSVDERSPANFIIGALAASDPDESDTHTFRLMNETTTFSITNNNLVLLVPLDYEIRPRYFLDIHITDAAGLSFADRLSITVKNQNDAPTDILFIAEHVDENISIGGLVGNFSTIDPDANTIFIYTLASGAGSKDNALFTINNSELRTVSALDYETSASLAFRVRSTEQGTNAFIEKSFILSIQNRNEPPTDLRLSNNTVSENRFPGTSVGQIIISDPDEDDTHSLRFASGSGDTDNPRFLIDNGYLKTREMLDYETRPTHNVRISVRDRSGIPYEETFSISVQNENEVSTTLVLSSNEVQEDRPSGTEVGTLSVAASSTFSASTYALQNSPDRNNFRIESNKLLTNAVLNYEVQIFYTLRIQARDNNGNTLTQEFVIILQNRNEVPSDILISSSEIQENAAVNTVIGGFSTTDPDTHDSFAYTLVGGAGADDNALFSIRGYQLRNTSVFDFETKDSYNIRVSTVDNNGASFEKTFVIRVTNLNEAPTHVRFAPDPLPENQVPGIQVGTFSTVDADAQESFTYTLVSGTGSTHNHAFYIVGNMLFAAETFDFEQTPTLSIRVLTRDKVGFRFERNFYVSVQDKNDPHTDIQLLSNSIDENQPIGTRIGTFSVSDSDNTPITYRITESSLPGAFRTQGNLLLSNRVFDFEQHANFRMTIDAFDEDGNTLARSFRIDIINLDDPPSGMQLSAQEVEENQDVGTVVGILSLIDEDGTPDHHAFTYLLVPGQGSDDNSDFKISDLNELLSAKILDHEAKVNRKVRVRALNPKGVEIIRTFTITVVDINDPPTESTLSQDSFKENQPAGSLIATISTEDQDLGDAFTYALEGEISVTSLLEIRGDQLYSRASFNYEARSEYAFSIQASDPFGDTARTPFILQIADDNDAPILVSNTFAVSENSPQGTLVGTVVADAVETTQEVRYNLHFSTDPSISYNSFLIESHTGNIYVQEAGALDYETATVQKIEVEATDNGMPPRSSRHIYEIYIEDVAEHTLPAPLAISPNGDGINDYWTIENAHLYSDMELNIFSSFGQIVYQSTDYQNDWDGTFRGKALPRGTYYYVFKDPEGKIAYRGTISLIK